MEIIILCAVLVFLVAVFVIYFKEIKSKLFIKKTKKPKNQKQQESPKKENDKVTLSVEDFVPSAKPVLNERDSSLDGLFDIPDDEIDDIINDGFVDEFIGGGNEFQDFSNDDIGNRLKRLLKSTSGSDKKSIAKQIKELPPEIKILLIDGILKKREDL